MAFKPGLMLTAAAASLLLLASCNAATDATDATAETPEVQEEPEAPASEADLEAAQADWQARQEEINQVLASMDRATFIGESPTKGNPGAEVVVVKFSDFECPFCAVASVHMKDFVDERGEEVLYVYKHLPLENIHPEAVPSAKASWAAGQQDQFWIYHNGLFANQERLGEPLYQELAEQIRLDVEQINRDRNSAAAQTAVDADIALATQLRLRGTPSFLLGGVLVPPGIPPESFGQLLDNLKAVPNPQE